MPGIQGGPVGVIMGRWEAGVCDRSGACNFFQWVGGIVRVGRNGLVGLVDGSLGGSAKLGRALDVSNGEV